MWACQIIPDCHTGPIHQIFFVRIPKKYTKKKPLWQTLRNHKTLQKALRQNGSRAQTCEQGTSLALGKSLYKPPHKETKNDKTPGQSCLLVGDLLVLIQVHDHSLGLLLSPAWRARSLINVGALPSNVLEGFEGLYRRYYVICSPNINSKRLPIDPQGFC